MNNNEEKNFKEYAKESTPDLWNKIENGLPEGMYTKDSSNEDNTTSDNTSKNSNEVSNQETQLENTFTKIKSSRIKEEIKALIEGSKKEGRSESVEIDNKNKKENPLTFISSIPARVVDKFCDGYSVRDGSCNKILDKLFDYLKKIW